MSTSTLPLFIRAEIIDLFYQTKSVVTIMREMNKRHPGLRKYFYRTQIHRIIKRFLLTGSIEDGRHENSGRPRSVREHEHFKLETTGDYIIDLTEARPR